MPLAAAVCERAIADGKVLGLHLFVQHEGQVVASVALGADAPMAAAAPDAVGELRCAVKPLTTLCLLQAAQANLLSLDDSLNRWAPAGSSPRIGRLRLRELLTHESGLPNLASKELFLVGFDEFVAIIFTKDVPARAWAGRPVYNYACSWHLLAWVLNQVYAQPIQDILEQQVVTPMTLRMRLLDSTGASHPYQRRCADGSYTPFRDTDAATFRERPNPGFGGFATTEDLGRFYGHLLRCLHEGSGVVPREGLADLLTRRGTVCFRPGGPTVPFSTGFFRGGGAVGFGAEWDPGCFGHMGSIGQYYLTGGLCDPRTKTIAAVRLTSIGLANKALLAALGRAIHADLRLPNESG
jgi:CubicO group peptidase (beta-lactamase class C family)